MTYIPPQVAETEMTRQILGSGLGLVYRGKVRDTFNLPGHPDLLLQCATDRLSIFDFVLGSTVPDKGAVLTALTVFWLTEVLNDRQHHIVAYGAGIDEYLPSALRGIPELQKTALVIRCLDVVPVEGVVRGYLTGSGWQNYSQGEPVCGHILRPGLNDGACLPEPIFTPTSKAEGGHDEPIDFQSVRVSHPGMEEFCIGTYTAGLDYSLPRDIIPADTKFEVALVDGQYVLVDEVLTPDSSRFWDTTAWEEAQSQDPPRSPEGFDKQYARNHGLTVVTPFGVIGIKALKPSIQEHCEWVGEQLLPREVVLKTTGFYHGVVTRLTGKTLWEFWPQKMDIAV
jgi:phosphoribosylaminoimidazole-succinocarboxamide synthase